MNHEQLDELERQIDERYAFDKEAIKRVREIASRKSSGQVEFRFDPAGIRSVSETAPVSSPSITDQVRTVARSMDWIFTAKNVRDAHPELTARQVVNAIATLRQKGEITVLKPGSGRRQAVSQRADRVVFKPATAA